MARVLHQLLSQSASAHPQRIAVRCKDEQLTYEELDRSSARLAASLVARGVERGGRVGLYMDKSPGAIAALFGILKAGACYVPLDPAAPPERQLSILRDCALEHIVVGRSKLGPLRSIAGQVDVLKYVHLCDAPRADCDAVVTGANLVCADEIADATGDVSERAASVSESDLGYILYTSGSTGQPKGVMISHGASRAFVDWARDRFAIGPQDTVSSHAPFHFDLSILDLFATIGAGATISIVPAGVSMFPASLARFVEQQVITVWYSVPMVLTQLVLHGRLEERDLSRLRTVLFAGEVFPTKYLRQLKQQLPHAELHNLYGPTETNVCTYHPVVSVPDTDDPIPIGKPCCGDVVAILDEDGRPVPRGAKGELYVAGPTLMNGYWADAEKTRRGLARSIAVDGQMRPAYRTGDLVRWNDADELEYHGRLDHMIKSRGYRIELGEIESALAAHADVAEVVVFGVPDEEIGKRIRAAVVLGSGSAVSEAELKKFCSQRLPAYMVPEAIRFRASMPRTSTHKIDRKQIEREDA